MGNDLWVWWSLGITLEPPIRPGEEQRMMNRTYRGKPAYYYGIG
jgi:hypothetical protein